ncbi:MAG: SurA N-terminal domain-containing protein [Deltaproteobacteria bacterium]|nr:SurA N-terminal domain-containing protein [Deltaproteobacteria bacterium]
MKYYKMSVFIILVALLINFASGKADAQKLLDKVVAVVNNDVITLYELNKILKPYLKKIEKKNPPDKDKAMADAKRQIFGRLIEKKLIDQEAARLNISVDKRDVDKSIVQFKKHNNLTDEGFKEFLRKQDITYEEYRIQIEEYIIRTLLLKNEVRSKVVITKEEISEYYNKNIDQYSGKKLYHLYNIIMHVKGFENYKEKEDVLKKITEVYDKIKNGASFTDMAVQYSDAPNASFGGDLGKISFDILSDIIKDAVSKIKPKEFTPIIETEQGFQIFYLKDIDEVKIETFEEISPIIEGELYKQHLTKKFDRWIADLKKKAYIKIMLED